MNPLPMETLGDLARHTVDGFVESQEALINMVVKAPRQAPKAHAAVASKPARKRRTAARAKALVATA